MYRAFEQATGSGAPQPAESTAGSGAPQPAESTAEYTWEQDVEAYGDAYVSAENDHQARFRGPTASMILPPGMQTSDAVVPRHLIRPTARLSLSTVEARVACSALRAAFTVHIRKEQARALQDNPLPDHRNLLTAHIWQKPCLWCGLPTGSWCDGCGAPLCTHCDKEFDHCPICAPVKAAYMEWQP